MNESLNIKGDKISWKQYFRKMDENLRKFKENSWKILTQLMKENHVII